MYQLLKKSYLFLVLALLFSPAVMAQAEGKIALKVFLSYASVTPGGTMHIAARVTSAEKFHINSNKPYEDFLIPTELSGKGTNGLQLTGIVYPPSKDYRFGFSDNPVAVYEGTVYIFGKVQIPQNFAPGKHPLKVMLDFQACNDVTCFAPDQLTEEVIISVAPAGTQEVRLNETIFRTIFAAEDKKKEQEVPVTMETFLSFDKVYAGNEVKSAVKLNLKSGFSIGSSAGTSLKHLTISVSSEHGITAGNPVYPQGREMSFPFLNAPATVIEGEAIIGTMLNVPSDLKPGDYKIVFNIQYQGTDGKALLSPSILTDTITVTVVESSHPITETNSEIFTNIQLEYSSRQDSEAPATDEANPLAEYGLLLGMLITFLGGLALNLTPCVYPLIPITIGYFTNQSEGSTGKLAAMGLFYVLGIALTYSVVGLVSALSGSIIGGLMQNPIVLIVIALVMVALALSMFGLYEFKLPDSWVNAAGGSRSGIFGAFLMGLTLGIVAAPCIGPLVAGLVTYVATQNDLLTGFLLFFMLGLGLGAPYFVLALFSGKIKALPRSGVWMESVKYIFGFIMIGVAIYFVLPLFPKSIEGYVLPVYMVLAALYLLIFDKKGDKMAWFKKFRISLSIIVILAGVYMIYGTATEVPPANWTPYQKDLYESAITANDKIIIDFYADWCGPCKELDRKTFSDPQVIKALSGFKTLKADLTKSGSEEVEELRTFFKVTGVPTVIIINSQGKEVKRITGFVPAEEFLEDIKLAE